MTDKNAPPRRRWSLLARYLAGEMSPGEEIAFRKQLERTPERKEELERMEHTWKYFDQDPAHRRHDSGQAWDELHTRLKQDGLLDTHAPKPFLQRTSPAFRIAATIVVTAAIGLPALYFGGLRNNQDGSIYQQRSEQGVLTVDLPDGSRIYLNEGAEISYPSFFREDRSLELKGEAFFEVMSDPVDPFTVRSGNVVVSVIGTSFNIRDHHKPDQTEVFVEAGTVRMTRQDNGEYLLLGPGELGRISGSGLEKTPQSDPNYIAWKTKDFTFVDANLEEVLQELEESYHVSIVTEGIIPAELRITTSYSEQSIDAILETIGAAFGLKVRQGRKGYYLSK